MLRHQLVLYDLYLAAGFVLDVLLEVIEGFDHGSPYRCGLYRCLRSALAHKRAEDGLSVGCIDRDQIHADRAIIVS